MPKNLRMLFAVGDILVGIILGVLAMSMFGVNASGLEPAMKVVVPLAALVVLARGVATAMSSDNQL